MLIEEVEVICWQLENININKLVKESGIVSNYDEFYMPDQEITTQNINNQASSSGSVRLTTIEKNGITTQPLRHPSSYEFS